MNKNVVIGLAVAAVAAAYYFSTSAPPRRSSGNGNGNGGGNGGVGGISLGYIKPIIPALCGTGSSFTDPVVVSYRGQNDTYTPPWSSLSVFNAGERSSTEQGFIGSLRAAYDTLGKAVIADPGYRQYIQQMLTELAPLMSQIDSAVAVPFSQSDPAALSSLALVYPQVTYRLRCGHTARVADRLVTTVDGN